MTAGINQEEAGPQRAGAPPSQQVSWWPTHVFISELVSQANNLPVAGTPAWCSMSTDDPRKLLALAVAGEHHVLRVETAQVAKAQAAQDISASADWSHIARSIRRRSDAHIPRRRTA